MMQIIRSNAGKFVTIVIVGGFLIWMVFGIGMEVSGAGGTRPGELGSVNGVPISLETYRLKVEQLTEQARQQTGGRLTPEQQRQLEDRAWEELVNDILLRQEMARRGITVSDAEIAFAAENIPHPQLAQQEIFQTDGQFDIAKYRAFLAGPQASDEIFAQLEGYYRDVIPQAKLQRQVTAGTFVSDAELWRAFRDREEKATVEYVALDLSRLAPGNPQVSQAEIRRYYDEHRDEFERPRTARFTVAYLATAVTEADRMATLAKANALRSEIAQGADFAEVAKRESADPASAPNGGDLGTFRRGAMVAAFDSAVFSLPVGQVSEPVQTEYGYHLIQVQASYGDSVKARHILLPVQKPETELAKLDARADSLEDLAERRGLEYARRAVGGVTLREGVSVTDQLPYIPGVGSALEALDWAAAEATDRSGPAKPVSPLFEGEQAFYVVRLEGYSPKGTLSLAEATPQITQALILEKKRATARAAGEEIVRAARGGRTLQQAAAAKGLSVQTAGPFSRVDPNPVFGQANAATGAAFGTPIGQVSDVVETTAGLFILRPTARTEADRRAFEGQKEQMRQMETYRLQQQQQARWLDSVRKRARIEDNREEFFGRAS
jgi:peptidyl-prolyl cis-trans isomerase D